jgi:hypothetical protein
VFDLNTIVIESPSPSLIPGTSAKDAPYKTSNSPVAMYIETRVVGYLGMHGLFGGCADFQENGENPVSG